MEPTLLPLKPYRETLTGGCGPASLKIVLDYYALNYEMPEERQVSGLFSKFQRKRAIIPKRSLLRFGILSRFRLKKFGENTLKAFRDPRHGVEKSEKELFELCDASEKLGTPAENLKKAAESLGFKVEIKDHSTYKDIQKWIDKKVPVIVDWFTRGRMDYDESEIADGHYSVVAGLDEEYIYLQDPELGGLRKITRENFMVVWFDFRGKHIKPDDLVIRQIIAIYK